MASTANNDMSKVVFNNEGSVLREWEQMHRPPESVNPKKRLKPETYAYQWFHYRFLLPVHSTRCRGLDWWFRRTRVVRLGVRVRVPDGIRWSHRLKKSRPFPSRPAGGIGMGAWGAPGTSADPQRFGSVRKRGPQKFQANRRLATFSHAWFSYFSHYLLHILQIIRKCNFCSAFFCPPRWKMNSDWFCTTLQQQPLQGGLVSVVVDEYGVLPFLFFFTETRPQPDGLTATRPRHR